MELPFFFSAHCLIVVYISTKFHENILGGIKVIERTRFSSEKFHNSLKNVGGVTVLVLCTSSDDGLYLYQVSLKYLDRRTDRQTDRQMDGGHDIIRPVFDGRIKMFRQSYSYIILRIQRIEDQQCSS